MRWLNLGAPKVTSAAVVRLIAALPRLTELEISPPGVNDAVLKAMADADRFRALHLTADSRVSDAGLADLARMTTLERLYVYDATLPEDWAAVLSNFEQLWMLNVGEMALIDEDVRHLAGLTNLTFVDLSDARVSEDGLRHLAGLPQLRRLTLGGTFDAEAFGRFQAAVPTLVQSYAPHLGDDADDVDPADRVTLRPGDEAPDFELPTTDGGVFRLSDQRGKVVLIHFGNTRDRWAVAATPRLKRLHDDLGRHPRVTTVSVYFDDLIHSPRRYAEREGLTWPQAFAGDFWKAPVTRAYGVRGMPTYVVVAPDGRVLANEYMNLDHVRDVIDDVLDALVDEGDAVGAVPRPK